MQKTSVNEIKLQKKILLVQFSSFSISLRNYIERFKILIVSTLNFKMIKSRELRLLQAHILQKDLEWIFLNQNNLIFTPLQKQKLEQYISRRERGEPLAKILGYKEFYGRNFYTNQYTLDPRPDSETMIDAVKFFHEPYHPLNILDLGIGTGCLLLTLLCEFIHATAFGVDKSFEALLIALKNQQNLNLNDRSYLINCFWTRAIRGKFNVIISNPPYISPGEQLDPETLHDPKDALFAGENGLADYKAILYDIKNFMTKDSRLFLEIGQGQLKTVDLLATTAGLHLEKVFPDLAGIDRVVCYRIS